jgi:hypothetical protein
LQLPARSACTRWIQEHLPRSRIVALVLVWTGAAVVCILLVVFSAFARIVALEAFPLGCLTGWLAHGNWQRSRRK